MAVKIYTFLTLLMQDTFKMAIHENPGARISVDFKLPLWGLLTAFSLACLMLAGLYFNVQGLTVAVTELQVTVKAGNAALVNVSSENAMQNYRLGAIEAEQSRMNDMLRSMQARGGK